MHVELAGLNEDATTLAATIQANFQELGVSAAEIRILDRIEKYRLYSYGCSICAGVIAQKVNHEYLNDRVSLRSVGCPQSRPN